MMIDKLSQYNIHPIYLQANKEEEEMMTLLAPMPDRRKSSILSLTRRVWVIRTMIIQPAR